MSSVLPRGVGVAVAKCSNKNIFIGNLGGRRSCHSYLYSPAGWLLPYRQTLSLEHNSSSPCDPNQGTDMYQSLGITSLHVIFKIKIVTWCHLSVRQGVLERLSARLSGEPVQSVYGRHRRSCDPALHWKPQWAVLWQYGGFEVCTVAVCPSVVWVMWQIALSVSLRDKLLLQKLMKPVLI